MPGLFADAYRSISAKTADYQLVTADLGKIFTNKGATAAVNFTLPAASGVAAGWWCEFFVVADQNVTITSTPADKMVTKGDAAADSIALSTAGELIGGGFRVVSDGDLWYVFIMTEETVTPTIAT